MKKILFGAAVTLVTVNAHGYVKNDFEKPAANEGAFIEAMAAESAKQVKLHRDAHAKANGCVDGVTFEVRRDLPKEYRVGIFAEPGKVYDGIARTSNGSGEVGAFDPAGGGQGLALKLFIEDKEQQKKLHAIKGESYFKEVDRKYYLTQDFLGINFREFFVTNAAEYLEFSKARGKAAVAGKAAFVEAKKAGKTDAEAGAIAAKKGDDTFKAEFLLDGEGKLKRPREAAVFAGLAKKTLNPLVEDFHSMVPSLFGADRAVKYRMHPCDPKARENYKVPKGIDAENDANFLRKTLAHHLRTQDTCYLLSVEFHGKDTPTVEDAVARWSEKPVWVTLGTIKIAKKDAGKELMSDDACEFPSYSPWRTLVDHQPIGSIQRVRERVYAEVFKARHENRGHKAQ